MSFSFSKFPSTIRNLAFGKKRPRSDTQDGEAIKKMMIELDVSDVDRLKACQSILPGSEALVKTIAGEDTAGGTWKGQRRLGTVSIKHFDSNGKLMFESATAKAGQPILKVGDRGLDVRIWIPIEAVLPRGKANTLEDGFRADGLTDMAPSQLDIEDAEKAVAKATTRRRGKNRSEQVTLITTTDGSAEIDA